MYYLEAVTKNVLKAMPDFKDVVQQFAAFHLCTTAS